VNRHVKHPAGRSMPPKGRDYLLTVSLDPGAVAAVRHDVAEVLASFGVSRNSAFTDAVLLVVSELVANVVRHAAGRSATAEVTVSTSGRHLVIGVEDQDPRLPDLSPQALGEGLRTVSELAAAYGGGVSVQPLAAGEGKTILVRFLPPDAR
jgi:signal transduction histidine kinase